MPEPNLDWVRGLADRSCQLIGGRDAAGNPISPALVMTSKDGIVLNLAAGVLRTINIECRISWNQGRCTLRVGGVDALRKWKSQVGFLDNEKSKQLDEVLRVFD